MSEQLVGIRDDVEDHTLIFDDLYGPDSYFLRFEGLDNDDQQA